jgi:hypothetical protein
LAEYEMLLNPVLPNYDDPVTWRAVGRAAANR